MTGRDIYWSWKDSALEFSRFLLVMSSFYLFIISDIANKIIFKRYEGKLGSLFSDFDGSVRIFFADFCFFNIKPDIKKLHVASLALYPLQYNRYNEI